MNYWLAQLVLAARNKGSKDWMQLLIFVVIAIFYAVGGILKRAAANRASSDKQGKQIPRKPMHKPLGGGRDMRTLKQKPWQPGRPKPAPVSRPRPPAVKPKPQVRPAGRKVVRPAAARSSVKSPKSAAGWKLPAEADGIVELSAFEPEPKLGKVPGLTGGVAAASMPQSEYLSEILSDYKDPAKLRRAILHYEILGKPISLRGPSEQFSGF